MRSDVLFLRAWAVSHRAKPAAAALGLMCTVVTGFADAPVPTWTAGTPLPLWALTPGFVAMVATTCTEDRLGAVAASLRRRVALARFGWCVAVVAVCATATWPVSASTREHLIPVTTAALVAVTFGLSCAVGMAASGLGAAVVAVALAFANRIPSIDPLRWIADSVGTAGLLAVAAAVVGAVACYAAAGSRSRVPDDAPD